MSTIPTSVTEEQFEKHIRPFVKTAKRGYTCKIPLYKIFNYILYHLHTGCQWHQLPIMPDADHPEKKKLAGRQSIIIGASGMRRVVLNRFGIQAFNSYNLTSIVSI